MKKNRFDMETHRMQEIQRMHDNIDRQRRETPEARKQHAIRIVIAIIVVGISIVVVWNFMM